jgi:Aspartyl/Asparaginyl beta-hydroxylase
MGLIMVTLNSTNTFLLKQSLNRIPHLNLTAYLNPPVNTIISEIDTHNVSFRPLDPYGMTDTRLSSYLESTFKVSHLILPPEKGIFELPDSKIISRPSDASHTQNSTIVQNARKAMPKTLKWISEFCCDPHEVLLSSLGEDGDLFWHSHDHINEITGYSQSQHQFAFIHIPLITSLEVKFGVRQLRGREPGTYWKHYANGEAWVFNSHFFHNAFNESKRIRLHLIVVAPVEDIQLNPILCRALREYDGPLMALE